MLSRLFAGGSLSLDHQPPSNPVCARRGISALKGWLGSMCEFHEHKSPQTLGSTKGDPQQLGARLKLDHQPPSNPVQPRPAPGGNQRALKGWLGSMCEFHEHKSPQTLGSRKGEPQQLGARLKLDHQPPSNSVQPRPRPERIKVLKGWLGSMCEFHEHKSPQTLGSTKGDPQQLGARLKLDHQPPSNPVQPRPRAGGNQAPSKGGWGRCASSTSTRAPRRWEAGKVNRSNWGLA